ncbi:hypothetical protein SAMN04488540_11721 [Ferrimonas sediminum]|uniref:Uncharacterized protein n=1 Tax=Ferrimonas sediminum TaxID=718193 RepID=A0A1G8YB60_9GAMM|nr:hypothetical protein [Ferrimonas sediminum]SDJ99903.1 hypothetical protein SAMN04488540_11721 [Ferrimonas sediminum]
MGTETSIKELLDDYTQAVEQHHTKVHSRLDSMRATETELCRRMDNDPTWCHLSLYLASKNKIKHLMALPCGVDNFDGWMEQQAESFVNLLISSLPKNRDTVYRLYLEALDSGDYSALESAFREHNLEDSPLAILTAINKKLSNNGIHRLNWVIGAHLIGMTNAAKSHYKQFFLDDLFPKAEFRNHLTEAIKKQAIRSDSASKGEKGRTKRYEKTNEVKAHILEIYSRCSFKSLHHASVELTEEAQTFALSIGDTSFRNSSNVQRRLYRWLREHNQKVAR